MAHFYTYRGPCFDCGVHIVKRVKGAGDRLCSECAITRAILAAQQMAAKSGPAWDKWLASKGPDGKTTGAIRRKA